MKDIASYKFIERLKQLSFVDEIWLFGSRARGDNQERSDIDLAILCKDAKDSDWLRVMDIVDNADTLLKIDCVRLGKKSLSKGLYNNILKDKVVLYAKVKN